MQCSKKLSVISSTDWERTIRAMKLHQYFEFGPASQDPFSFCQIQLTINTLYVKLYARVEYILHAPSQGLRTLLQDERKNFCYKFSRVPNMDVNFDLLFYSRHHIATFLF